MVCDAGLLTLMQIYVSRAGQEFGPYSLDDVNAYLESGQLNANDLAWFEGETDWKPLRELFGLPASANNPREQKANQSTKDADGVAQLAAIAKCRTHLRLAVAFLFLGVGVIFAVFGEGSLVANLSVVTGGVLTLIATYRLAKAIRSPVAWLYCVLQFVPLVNLITLLVLDRKASKLIKQGGGQEATGTSSTDSKIAIGALILLPIIAVIGVMIFVIFGGDK